MTLRRFIKEGIQAGDIEVNPFASYENEVLLANSLKEIYYEIVIEESYSDSFPLSLDIITLVEASISEQQEIFNADPSSFHRIPSTHNLAKSFVSKYENSLRKADEFAFSVNTRYGYFIDVASVVCPYVLYQLGITDENISFYIGLGMVISNIICDSLSKRKESRVEAAENKRMTVVIREMKKMLEYSKGNSWGRANLTQINRSILELDKVLQYNDIDMN